jgi:hypothetical protein
MGLVDIILRLSRMREVPSFELYTDCPRCLHAALHLLGPIDAPIFRASRPAKKPGVLEATSDGKVIFSVDLAPPANLTVHRLVTRECRSCLHSWQEVFEDTVQSEGFADQLKAMAKHA